MEKQRYPSLPVLLVDDEKPWLRSLSIALERIGGINHSLKCHDSRQVMDLLSRQPVSLVLLDLTMPHVSGEELLGMIAQDYPDIPVIILSGLNQVDTAVKCMKAGAFDYFVKTVEEDRLIAGVHRAIHMQELRGENRRLKEQLLDDRLEKPEVFSPIVGCSSQVRSIFQYIEAVAGSSEPVLLTGESGVGKELFARAVHNAGKAERPWVTVNAAGLDDNVFSDTLFGHTRGAFTGADKERPGMIEQAAGGTLFLDEIGDLSLSSQVKLLRLLQEGEYLPLGSDKPKRSRARIVVATNQDLDALQRSGSFRKDLFYRLRAHHIQIPPLRDRSEDIPLLLDAFLDEASMALGKKKPTPPPELAVLLSTYHFPGNVRELRAMVFDAVSVHRSGKLSMETFKRVVFPQGEGVPASDMDAQGDNDEALLVFTSRFPTIEQALELLVKEAMERTQGNQSIAAGMLGISRPALYKRLKKLAV